VACAGQPDRGTQRAESDTSRETTFGCVIHRPYRRPRALSPLREHLWDRKGRVRLEQEVAGWGDLVDLGFAEMRGCVAGSPQVTRRMTAGFDGLLRLVPPDRREPLERQRALLVHAVRAALPAAAERAFALEPDCQGIR
jgi:hypothetical protein